MVSMSRGVFGKRSATLQSELLPGQVVLYGRKSKKDESATKSLGDQAEVCLEVCADYGIPATLEDYWPEEAGHGGDEWYEGVTLYGNWGLDGGEKPATRPVLTKIVQGVVGRTIKCIVIYSQDRLWRSVSICEALINLFAKHNVLLFDRNGPVDISTPEGRQSTFQNAVAAQNYREVAAVGCMRGVTKSRDKGKLVTYADMLGFRAVGGKSGKINHIAEEQELVRRIFRLCDSGENGSGPMSPYQIARLLTAQKLEIMPDLQEKRYYKRHADSQFVVYAEWVRRLLQNVRYVGMQPHEGENWPCPAYLNDGHHVIELALFERVQLKLKAAKRVGQSGVNNRALAGRIHCGLCGQPMEANSVSRTYVDGTTVNLEYWTVKRSKSGAWCNHAPPSVRVDTLDDYLDDILAPLLLGELRERSLGNDSAATMNEYASVQKRLNAAMDYYHNVLPSFDEHISPELLGRKERNAKKQIADLKATLRDLDASVQALGNNLPHLENITGIEASLRKDVYRQCLEWVCVLPSTAPDELKPGYRKKTRPPKDAGRILMMTTYGTLHCATIYRRAPGGHNSSAMYRVRASTEDEIIGSIANLPDPEAFLKGLERAYHGRHMDFDLTKVAPGYVPSQKPPIAAFDLWDDADSEPVVPHKIQ